MTERPVTAISEKSRLLRQKPPYEQYLGSPVPTGARAKLMKSDHLRNASLITLLIALFLLSLCFGTRANEFIPYETMRDLGALFRSDAVKAQLPYYEETAARLKLSSIALLSGVVICAAGATFQTIFKNPIASPNMIGVSTGVSFGNIFFVMSFGLSAASHLPVRYLYCYGSALVLVSLSFLVGKLAGRRLGTFSVEATIIAGMMITHLGQVFLTYYQMQLQADETGLLEIYTQLVNGDILYQDMVSLIVFFSCTAVSLIPMILLCYRFNAVAFNDDEMKAQGVSNNRLRTLGLLLGSLMAAIALIHCGDVGFLSMIVPFMVRKKLQTDFRQVLFLSGVLGGIFTLAVRIIISIFNSFTVAVPAGVIMTIVLMPVFVVSLKKRGSGFE